MQARVNLKTQIFPMKIDVYLYALFLFLSLSRPKRLEGFIEKEKKTHWHVDIPRRITSLADRFHSSSCPYLISDFDFFDSFLKFLWGTLIKRRRRNNQTNKQITSISLKWHFERKPNSEMNVKVLTRNRMSIGINKKKDQNAFLF